MDVIWVALISAGGAVLGAIVGSLSTIFGPVWQERRARAEEAARAADDLRYERLLAFLESLNALTVARQYSETTHAAHARSAFVATLRPGEGRVETFTREVMNAAHGKQREGLQIVSEAGDRLFGWLRGDVAIETLTLVGEAPPSR